MRNILRKRLMRKTVKKISCFMLSVALTFSLVACGKNDVVVDDYGNESGSTVESEEVGTATDSDSDGLNVQAGDGKTLRQIFGDRIDWKESTAVGDMTLDIDATYFVPDIAGMNVYSAKLVGDGIDQEETLVKTLFGDSAKKLDKITISNETDYMTMAYKYKKIMFQLSMYSENFDFSSSSYSEQFKLINVADEETFEWVDEDKYFIHMYEGDYEGTRFCLLLAYDRYAEKRTIFFDPVSINEYFPDKDYRTLYIEGSNDSQSQPLEIENQCTKSIDEVKEEASQFLEEKLGIPSNMNHITTNPSIFKSSGTDNITDFDYTEYLYKDPGVSVLSFTHSDFLSAIITRGHGGEGAGYQVLADQEDRYSEAEEGKYDSIYQYIIDNQNDVNESENVLDYDINGYAVYLNDAIFEGETGEHVSAGGAVSMIVNTGRIKVTDKGIMGVDLTLVDEITDITENVRLLEFDKIMEAFKEQIGEKTIPDDVKQGASKLTIQQMDLTLIPYSEEPDSTNFSYIPVWQFLVQGNDYNVIAVFINAMDGSMINTVDY